MPPAPQPVPPSLLTFGLLVAQICGAFALGLIFWVGWILAKSDQEIRCCLKFFLFIHPNAPTLVFCELDLILDTLHVQIIAERMSVRLIFYMTNQSHKVLSSLQGGTTLMAWQNGSRSE